MHHNLRKRQHAYKEVASTDVCVTVQNGGHEDLKLTSVSNMSRKRLGTAESLSQVEAHPNREELATQDGMDLAVDGN